MTATLQRGIRRMFSPHIVGVALSLGCDKVTHFFRFDYKDTSEMFGLGVFFFIVEADLTFLPPNSSPVAFFIVEASSERPLPHRIDTAIKSRDSAKSPDT